ncbi:TlpA family protein disulfide reductase [Pseudofulvibacter geojedonensis]|uniref:TlpA family protein disulfide reductase n=1 Tax=Pseudofulvibacter geojedonensis TaxID=1123758 RepID=A0ABW3HZY6_9FLAO
MKFIVYSLIFILTSFSAFSQRSLKDSLFSEVIYTNIKSYSYQANQAYATKNFAKGKELFRNFIQEKVANKYLDNFKAKNLNGALVSINSYFKKPVILITYASWCVVEEGEIPALNELAKRYHDKIDFVVLFWDNANKARKQAKQFNNKVTILYIDERENMFASEVKNLKHALGFPLAYYIDSEDRIIDIKKKTPELLRPKESYIDAYVQNYNEFVDGLNSLLINGEAINEYLVGK